MLSINYVINNILARIIIPSKTNCQQYVRTKQILSICSYVVLKYPLVIVKIFSCDLRIIRASLLESGKQKFLIFSIFDNR